MLAKISSGQISEWPYDAAKFYADNPNVYFPNLDAATVEPFGAVVVAETPRPACDARTESVTAGMPALVSGAWREVWIVSQASAAEIQERDAAKAAEVRDTRDALLAASDWTQLPDAPVDQPAWAAYRQALRDVTAQPGFPWSVIWPSQP